MPWLFLIHDLPLYTFFIGTLLLGMVGGAQFAYFSLLPAAAAHSLGVVLPLAVRLALVGEPIYGALAGLCLIYLGVVLSITSRMNASLLEAWRLRYRLEDSEQALEQRVAERTQELHAAHAGLERQVAERTRELTEENAERRRAQEQLIIFQRFADHSTQSFGIADLDGTVINANPHLHQAFGYRGIDDLLGKSLAELHTPEFAEIMSGELPATVHEDGRWSGEVMACKADGEPFPTMESYFLIRDDRDQPLCMGFAITDLSERKLAEEKLRQSMAEADDANRAKSDFLSAMSHELRTPLNAILGFAQLLDLEADEHLDAEQQTYVSHILKGGQHLLTLINEILDLSKIESGTVVLSIETVALRPVIDESLTLLSPLADRFDVTLVDQTRDAEIPPVRGDTTRLKQILINLLSNAIKYNRANGTVTLSVSREGETMLRLSVSDAGAGIPEDEWEALFTPFSRLGMEAGSIEGTGIGLAICRRLIELMDGAIGLSSPAGEGATFWIDIPLATGDEAGTSHRATTPAAPGSAAGETRSLLYVEDNPSNLRLIEKVLDHVPGVAMTWADSAELALVLIKGRHPDAILLDINLPGMNGFQFLEVLRGQPKFADIPVVALSAEGGEKDAKTAHRYGLDAFLAKPIEVQQVIAALTKALDRGARQRADERKEPRA